MKLSEYKKDYYFFSGKVSDLTRQMAFAGLAIIWVFKSSIGDKISIEKELFLPAILFVLSLSFDICQYIYQTIAWNWFFEKHEKAKVKEDDDILAPRWMNYPSNVFFWLKVFALLSAYVIIIRYLSENLFK